MNVPFKSAVPMNDSDTDHHWSKESQPFATAATLLRYMRQGWKLVPQAEVKSFAYHGGRHVDVYYFMLTKNEHHLEMPVLMNPVVRRFITYHQLQVTRVSAQEVNLREAPPTRQPEAEAVNT